MKPEKAQFRWDQLQRPSPLPEGTRIRLIEMPNDPDPIEPGSEGTVGRFGNGAQISVKWDNGRTLALLPDVDTYEVIESRGLDEAG